MQTTMITTRLPGVEKGETGPTPQSRQARPRRRGDGADARAGSRRRSRGRFATKGARRASAERPRLRVPQRVADRVRDGGH
eukprot:1184701-Prymnesium_polylepis.1